jgi:UDP-N-acetylglucosamine 4,6-dehydratase/5-epimerase
VLSTDKAVYPINAMGISKAMMEKVMVAKSHLCDPETVLCGTRYGNVMASRGSVIPLFVTSCARGQPLTVTDPDMTRFLMSLDESVDLVLYAFEHGKKGTSSCRRPRPPRSVTSPGIARIAGTCPTTRSRDRHAARREALRVAGLSREEMAPPRIWATTTASPRTRDLNYDKYFVEGEPDIRARRLHLPQHHRLDVEEVKAC